MVLKDQVIAALKRYEKVTSVEELSGGSLHIVIEAEINNFDMARTEVPTVSMNFVYYDVASGHLVFILPVEYFPRWYNSFGKLKIKENE